MSRWSRKIFWKSDEGGFEGRVAVLQLFVLATMEMMDCHTESALIFVMMLEENGQVRRMMFVFG